jgi:hypothetical protein
MARTYDVLHSLCKNHRDRVTTVETPQKRRQVYNVFFAVEDRVQSRYAHALGKICRIVE